MQCGSLSLNKLRMKFLWDEKLEFMLSSCYLYLNQYQQNSHGSEKWWFILPVKSYTIHMVHLAHNTKVIYTILLYYMMNYHLSVLNPQPTLIPSAGHIKHQPLLLVWYIIIIHKGSQSPSTKSTVNSQYIVVQCAIMMTNTVWWSISLEHWTSSPLPFHQQVVSNIKCYCLYNPLS